MKDMHDVSARQSVSALVDGETDAQGAAALSARWRDDAEVRACWHRYQLIGDVMRSDELAGGGADAAFLQRLRVRLEQEPVVLAPAAPPRRRGMRRWAPPAAVAAGFLAVAGALTVMRTETPSASAPQLAAAPPVTAPVLPVAASAAEVATPTVAHADPEPVERGSGRLLRDARLDRYLAAHQQFGGSSALGVPSGFLRSATYEGPAAAAGSR